MRYAELQVTTNYTFLRGASHPDELVLRAAALGLSALAVTDRNSLAGVVRAHVAAKQAGLRLVVGSRLDLTDGASLLCFPTDRAAYGRLARLLTLGKRRAGKGDCLIGAADVVAHGEGQILVMLPGDAPDAAFADRLAGWARRFPGRCYLAAQRSFGADDAAGWPVWPPWPNGRGADGGDQRRALSRPVAPGAAGRAVLYPRGLHHRRSGPAAGCQCRTPSEAAGGNGPAVRPSIPRPSPARVEIAERCRFSLDELATTIPSRRPACRRTTNWCG